MKTKKILALLASALLLICLVVGGATLAALYSKTNEKQNVFTTANPSVDIEENSSGTPDSSNDIPVENGIAAKQVKIQNTGDISLFVRVMLIPGWKQAGPTGSMMSLPIISIIVLMFPPAIRRHCCWKR